MGKTLRAIEEVESWDGAASNYEDTEAYCSACLIDVNEAAGNTEKKQSHCLLPVKLPGSSNMADKAVIAAAGARGITAVKKPSGVSGDDWDAALVKAANTLVKAYDQMDREPPASLLEFTGEEPGSDEEEEDGETEERSVMFEQVYDQLFNWSYAEPGRPWFSTFYLEQGALYGLFNDRGALYRAAIDIDSDGQTVLIGEMEPVIHEFTPISRSSFRVQRNADGSVRFFMIAGTAIVNRVGEIDSTKLYDDMIKRAEDSGFYPTLDFYHLGESSPELFEYGQFDFLGREGVVYIGSGLFDMDNPLAEATIRALEEDGDTWGASIEYYRPENRGVEYVKIGNGIEIAAFTEGLNTRISILPEADAAAWFTGVSKEKRSMNERQKKALKALYGDDEEGYNELMERSEGINKDVKDRGLVHRSTSGKTAKQLTKAVEEKPAAKQERSTEAKAEEPAAEEETEATLEGEIELDETLVAQIVTVARQQFAEEFKTAMGEQFGALKESIDAVLSQLNGVQEEVQGIKEDEEEKKRTWLEELPSRVQKPTRATFRPREQRANTEPEKEATFADKAANVLDKLPQIGV